MTRVMYDSTNIQDDPLDAQLVAYYIDGIYATSVAPVIARFPHAVLVPISAIGTNAGIVGDVEPGCMTVGEAVGWVQTRRAAGADPTLYVNEMHGWAPVRFAFRSAGIPEPHYWVANYDGVVEIPVGAVAKQYANPTLTHGHFDKSVVADYWPGVDGLHGGGLGQVGGISGGNMALAPHPTMAGRIDELVIGLDKAIWHVWGDLSNMTPAIESWGGQGVPGTLSAAWMPDGSVLVASVLGANGQLYRKALKVDGSILYDWNPVHNAEGSLPSGPAGKDGLPGKDGSPGKDGLTPSTGTIAGPLTVTFS